MVAAARPPQQAYAAIAGTFVAGLAGAGLLAKALGRDPAQQRGLDLLMLGAARPSRRRGRSPGTR